jgi:DNA-binding YbaB/EbfC family protein
MKNLGQMLKQAQELQARMGELQEKLAAIEVTGSAGGGMVTVTVNGKGESLGVTIDPKLMAPGEQAVVEDLVRAAINDAKGKLERLVRDKMSELTGGLPLPPGLQLPF